MLSVALLLAGGNNDKGGIERVTEYTYQEIVRLAPDIRVMIQRTRTGNPGLGLHLSVIPALLAWTGKLLSSRIDVVHLNVAPRGSTFRKMLFLLPAKARGARIILHLHGSGFHQYYASQKPFTRSLIRRFFRSADLVVVLGAFWKDFAIRQIGVDEDRVIEVSNGVPDPGAVAALQGEPPRILFAGAVGERKGVDILLHALANLRKEGAHFTCDILGDGEIDRFSALCATLGLEDVVTFHGWQDMNAVRAAMSRSDIFTLPSRAENQPVAILEAMAVGLPVVASSVGAIPEQVITGQTGYVVEPARVEALQSALSTLLASADLRRAFGERARARWQECFSSEANAVLLLDAYRKLAGSRA